MMISFYAALSDQYRTQFARQQQGRAILAEEREAKLITELAAARHTLRFWRAAAWILGCGMIVLCIAFAATR